MTRNLINTYGMSDYNNLAKHNLYSEFLAERDEILRHKWFESEKAGYDIGFDKALMEWIVRYRKEWRQSRKLHY